MIGINDPTSAAKNYKQRRVENILIEWVKRTPDAIAGHTHRPVLPDYDETPYFNDAVYPCCITAIEIVMEIFYVKWCYMTRFDGTFYVGKEVLVCPKKLQEYFNC